MQRCQFVCWDEKENAKEESVAEQTKKKKKTYRHPHMGCRHTHTHTHTHTRARAPTASQYTRSCWRRQWAFFHYRKRFLYCAWVTFVSSRERERESACDVIDITLKSRVIMHMITSTARWPYAYAYASTRSEPAPAVECSKCMTSQNHKQQLLRPRSGSSKIQKHIPEQPGWMNSKYWGNIEKRNQINTKNYWK